MSRRWQASLSAVARWLVGAPSVDSGAPTSGTILSWGFTPQSQLVGYAFYAVVAVAIILSPGYSTWERLAGAEAIYLASLVPLQLVRFAPNLKAILVGCGAALMLSVLLNLAFPGEWGSLVLYVLGFTLMYRLPARWSLPGTVVVGIALALGGGLGMAGRPGTLGGSPTPQQILDRWGTVVLYVGVCWLANLMRSRYVLVQELQATQAQLRAEMERTAELAATRERARIARDIHDVLAHSLTVLSVQTQAARQLVQQHRDHVPERLAGLLDGMAALLRESLAESRRVVGLLREGSAPGGSDSIAQRLRVLADRFGERTGVRCTFDESGIPFLASEAQGEALQYALQEALTNAYRHAGAPHVRITLQWHDAQVTLQVIDDGRGADASKELRGSGQGLRGMRERAVALGGTLEAAPVEDGGFFVTLTLPVERMDHVAAARTATHTGAGAA